MQERQAGYPQVVHAPPSHLVFCVVCSAPNGAQCIHIFSTMEKLNAFIAHDDRQHFVFDYVVDCPERVERLHN